jgi:hypothetical protein
MTMLSVTIPVSGCQEAQDPLPAHLLLIFMYLQMTPLRSFPIRLCHPSASHQHQPCIPCRFPSNPARFVQPSEPSVFPL